MSSRTRIGGLAALCTIALLALSGCVGIPSGGPVNPGPPVRNGSQQAPGVDLPLGPRPNASPTEMVNDFLQAATDATDNYGIARKFLTAKAAQSWDATKSVLVRERPATPQDIGANTVDYSVSTKASVNSLGVYVEQGTDSTQTLSYTFTKVNGQWRISDLPDGIVLSRTSFVNSFRAYPVYFFDPDYRYLVPDLRWFPTESSVQDRIVSALLAGPSDWLQGAVASAFPAGVGFVPPVSVRGSTATVDFSANAASTKAEVRGRMWQQLEESLHTPDSTPTISAVSMTAHGAPLVFPDSQESHAQIPAASSSAALIQKGKQFGYYAGQAVASLGGISTRIVQLGGTAAVLDRGGATGAVLAKAGVYLVNDTASKLIDARPDLIPPSIDTFGYVWSVPSDQPTAIQATGSDGVAHSVTSTIPTSASIVSLNVSHDGTRVLLYLATSEGPRLVVAGISRRGGVPTALGPLLDLPVSQALPIDATWVDSTTVAALGSENGDDTVISYVIGGSPGDASTTEGGVRLVGGIDADSLRVLTDSGEVQQLRASGWQNIGVVASILATQQ
jgi:Lipoprotein LpqB beta-propeller domain/Sporulation and spore germination